MVNEQARIDGEGDSPEVEDPNPVSPPDPTEGMAPVGKSTP